MAWVSVLGSPVVMIQAVLMQDAMMPGVVIPAAASLDAIVLEVSIGLLGATTPDVVTLEVAT